MQNTTSDQPQIVNRRKLITENVLVPISKQEEVEEMEVNTEMNRKLNDILLNLNFYKFSEAENQVNKDAMFEDKADNSDHNLFQIFGFSFISFYSDDEVI